MTILFMPENDFTVVYVFTVFDTYQELCIKILLFPCRLKDNVVIVAVPN